MRPTERPQCAAALEERAKLRSRAEELSARAEVVRSSLPVAGSTLPALALRKASAALEIAAAAYAETDPRVLSARSLERRKHRISDALLALDIASRFLSAAEREARTEAERDAARAEVRRRA